jgi:hypothetical protein
MIDKRKTIAPANLTATAIDVAIDVKETMATGDRNTHGVVDPLPPKKKKRKSSLKHRTMVSLVNSRRKQIQSMVSNSSIMNLEKQQNLNSTGDSMCSKDLNK